MSNWNKNPSFVDIENINTNNKFEVADGITYRDMNTIVENLQNLKNTVDGIDPGTNSPIIYLDDYYMPTNKQRTVGAPLHALEVISNPKCEVAIGKDKTKLQRIKNNTADNTVLYCMYDYNLDRFATYTFNILSNTIIISAWMPLLSDFIKQSEFVSFFDGVTELPAGVTLTIEPYAVYIVQCLDSQGNSQKLQVVGDETAEGTFAIIISSESVNTGTVIISDLDKNVKSISSVQPSSNAYHLVYCKMLGKGLQGPQGPKGEDGIGLTPEYEEYLFNATYKDPMLSLIMGVNTDAVVNNKYLFTQTLSIIFKHRENIISNIYDPILDLLFDETEQNTSNIPISSVNAQIMNVPIRYKITKNASEFVLRLKYKKRADDTNIYTVNSSANVPAGYALYVGIEEPTKLYKGNIEDIIYNGTKNVSINTSAGQSIYIAFPGTVTARTQASLSTEVPLTLVKTANFIVYDSQTGTTALSEVTAYNIYKTAALKVGANNLILTLRGN